MKFRHAVFSTIWLLVSGVSTQIIAANQSPPSPWNYPKALGWVSAPNNPYNICNGYYVDFPIPFNPNPLLASQLNSYDVTADQTVYSATGTTVLRGHVRITQPDKQLDADTVYLDRNPTTNKIEIARAYGNVRLFEAGKLLVGTSGQLNLAKNTMVLNQTAYRMEASPPAPKETATRVYVQPITAVENGQTEYQRYGLTYWGHAKTIYQTAPHHFMLKQSTYSTCPPGPNCAWHLEAKTVHLDHDKQVGDAWNSVLWVKNVPVFYMPYVNFPLSHERKSGFLAPIYGNSQTSGVKVAVPYYWNIAPNYDALFTPAYLTERGSMFTGLFRYLTQQSSGDVRATFLPHDSEFAHFQETAPSNPEYESQPQGLKNLEQDSDARYSLNWNDTRVFNQHWTSNVIYHQVSDDYYVHDIGNSMVNNSENQLLQQGQLQYRNTHWQFLGLLQNYQTLHPINQAVVDNQYARLPELRANGFYPQVAAGFDAGINTDAVKFDESKVPDEPGAPVIGERYNANPVISYPINEVYGYLTPRLQEEAIQYNLSQQGAGMPASPSNTLPIFDTDGKLYFNRYIHMFSHTYRQTLEPELYYLYVPYKNQNDLPIFDTSTQTINYDFLFLDNRFTGIDRIGDANQMTYAVTSRIIDAATGAQKGSVSIGDIYYFQKRRVALCTGVDCDPTPLDSKPFSPVAAQGVYYFNNHWSGSTNLTWDQYLGGFSNESANLNYGSGKDLLNFGYTHTRQGEVAPGSSSTTIPSSELEQVNVSGAWLIRRHWDLLGRWSYSFTGNQSVNGANAYLAGIEYDSCCWAVRLIQARTFLGLNTANQNQFNNETYLEFDLKGFGSVGTDDPSNLLKSNIGGYQDDFDQVIA